MKDFEKLEEFKFQKQKRVLDKINSTINNRLTKKYDEAYLKEFAYDFSH